MLFFWFGINSLLFLQQTFLSNDIYYTVSMALYVIVFSTVYMDMQKN